MCPGVEVWGENSCLGSCRESAEAGAWGRGWRGEWPPITRDRGCQTKEAGLAQRTAECCPRVVSRGSGVLLFAFWKDHFGGWAEDGLVRMGW